MQVVLSSPGCYGRAMSIGPRERLHLLGLATWSELVATVEMTIGAVLRNDGERVEALRRKAHDILDQHIDAKIEGVGAIRESIKREFDGR